MKPTTRSLTPPHPFQSIPGLPDGARPLLEQLLFEPPMPVKKVAGGVAVYRRVIERTARHNVHTSLDLGLAIADVLHAILARVDERTSALDFSVIQATALYFLIEGHGSGQELEREDGLFEDARVVNAMLRWLGRDDLALPLPVPASERPPVRDLAGHGGPGAHHSRAA